jgi:hypothetical protein
MNIVEMGNGGEYAAVEMSDGRLTVTALDQSVEIDLQAIQSGPGAVDVSLFGGRLAVGLGGAYVANITPPAPVFEELPAAESDPDGGSVLQCIDNLDDTEIRLWDLSQQ